MIVSTRICDLCGMELDDYIPQVQIMGKPHGGWKMTGYSTFSDVCRDCHDKIVETVVSLKKEGAVFKLNSKQTAMRNEYGGDSGVILSGEEKSKLNFAEKVKKAEHTKHKVKLSEKDIGRYEE